jgi:hypothetical protein
MRQVALAWLGSRLLLMVSVLVVARVAGVGAERHPLASGVWLLDRFAYWDSYHFVRIAEAGYLPPGLGCCDQATPRSWLCSNRRPAAARSPRDWS